MAVLLAEIQRVSPRYFLGANVHRNNNGSRLDFESRHWLVPLYHDYANHIVIKKASQVGITEFALVDMFWLAGQGLPGMYVLPTDIWRSGFVANRIDRTLDLVSQYRIERKDNRKRLKDSVAMKEICGTICKFIGANVLNNFYEFPASWYTVDEFDRCDQINLLYAEDRLGADLLGGRTRKFGNPTIGGFGIDAEFQKSDQKYWLVKCEHCNHSQVLGWFTHFVDDGSTPTLKDKNGNPICEKCGRGFDRLGHGEWVAKRPTVEISGYTISKLFGDTRTQSEPLPIIQLLTKYSESVGNPTALQRFWNNDLGESYESEGSKITEPLLASCAIGEPMPSKASGTVAGCDIGGVLHLHISEIVDGQRRKVFAGTVRDFDELERMCRIYGVAVIVCDALPETHAVRDFCRQRPGALMCYYVSDSKNTGKPNYKERTVTVGRTESLDASYQDYALGRVVLPKSFRSIDGGDFVSQMTAPTRVYDDKRGKYVWDEGSRPDHHRHADNYEKIAASLYRGEIIGEFI